MSDNDIKPVAVLCETEFGRYWSANIAVKCLPLGDYYHKSAIDRLTAERDAAVADAERYRWLRDRKFSFSHDEESRGIAGSRWGEWPYDTDEGHAAVMDAAIDAARAEGVV